MWKEEKLKLDNIFVTPQVIHIMVKVNTVPDSWLFYVIYVSPDYSKQTTI